MMQRNEQWKPMPEVLRGYAKDMDTNTRLIDGDIAPYLRKVADWMEAPRTITRDELLGKALTSGFMIRTGYGRESGKQMPDTDLETLETFVATLGITVEGE